MAGKRIRVMNEHPDNPNKDEYLSIPEVLSFLSWLESRLDAPGALSHRYYLSRAKCYCHFNNLYEAYEKYWWPYRMTCPVQGRMISGANFKESFAYMNELSRSIRLAVRNSDVTGTHQAALAMLKWGGVLSGNRKRIEEMGEKICKYFGRAEGKLNLSTARLGEHKDIIISSGFTKLYSLLIDGFIMYDGRVGAALGLMSRLFAQDEGLKEIPEPLLFSYGSGRVWKNSAMSVDRRNPSRGQHRFPNFNYSRHRHLNDNIRSSWLLQELADRTKSEFRKLPSTNQQTPLDERITAIQSALFMIGYDVANITQS